MDNTVSRSHRTLNESSSAQCISVGGWLESPQRLPKPYSILPSLLAADQTKWWDPIAKETTHCGCRAQRNQAGTELEEPFLWALVALEGAMWLFKEKSHGQSYPTENFVSYNTNFLDKPCPLEWWWHDWCEDDQHLYDWIWACSTGEHARRVQ